MRVFNTIKFGFVGSGEYKNKKMVEKTLIELVCPNKDIVVSGRSPRNDYDNVDIWAEEWANIFCKIPPIIHPAKEFTSNGFFARNKLVADDSDFLICFINRGQYKSGTWNTIKHFTRKGGKEYGEDWFIYDEDGKEWQGSELPRQYRKWV